MKIEGLILALSFILLIGIANAQSLSNQSNVSLFITHIKGQTNIPNSTIYSLIPINEIIKSIPTNNVSLRITTQVNLISGMNLRINNQTSCNFVVFTISTNANIMNCFIKPQLGLINVGNITFGKPLFFYYNSSKNPNEKDGGILMFFLHNKLFLFPANSSILISVYTNGSVFESNKLLYKFSKPQDEIGSYSFFIAGTSTLFEETTPYFLVEYYGINASINMPILKSSLPNNNLVFGYEHGFNNATITETSNDMLELFDIDENIILANSTSPLIYNLYKLIPINYAHLINPIYNYAYPFSNISESLYAGEQNYLVAKDENISYDFYPNEFGVNIFKPYFWINNSEPAFVSNVVGSKVLEINFTNVSTQSIHSIFNCNIIFENKLMENLNFQTNGNLSLNMATNPNETEIINGNLIYTYDNKTYYYNFTNLSLTQGQLKRIVIPIVPVVITTSAKCNIDLCILLILIIIILLIIIAWRIKKHLENKNRKVK